MRAYSGRVDRTVDAGDFTAATLASATTIRPELFYLQIGSPSTPADNMARWWIQRFTAAGTGTAFTPVALDPADPASLATFANDHTAEPTYTAGAVLLDIAMNQRSSIQWWCHPSFPLRAPNTAANGLGLLSIDATGSPAVPPGSVAYCGTMHWRE